MARLATGLRRLRRLVQALPRLSLSRSPASYYTYLGNDLLGLPDDGFADAGEPLWLNLGYWRSARSYPEACRALALLLAEAARLGPADEVLDVGFGFAEQDLLWLATHDVRRIVGVNVTPLHVRLARRRVERRGLAERIDLRLGSATDLPFADASFDKVTALECAFHFRTREKFFGEALRVLRPGGRLALTDMLPRPGTTCSGLRPRLSNWIAKAPLANMYDRDTYREKLARAGFEDVAVRSIANQVYPGAARCLRRRGTGEPLASIVVDLSAEDVAAGRGTEEWERSAGLGDYIVATADKPGGPAAAVRGLGTAAEAAENS